MRSLFNMIKHTHPSGFFVCDPSVVVHAAVDVVAMQPLFKTSYLIQMVERFGQTHEWRFENVQKCQIVEILIQALKPSLDGTGSAGGG